jgi:6,7-dimethyl-8-ribityllumazine synthase
MANYKDNAGLQNPNVYPQGNRLKLGIAVAEWNSEVTGKLLEGTLLALSKCGVAKENIIKIDVPGSFELTSGAQFLLQNHSLDAVICLGCVVQGETRHFDFICDAVANGLTQVAIKHSKPVIFGVLTTNNQQQALERCGGKHGHKGEEAAVTAVKMALLKDQLGKAKIGF